MDATRSTETKPDGVVLLTLRGERGAVQAMIMKRPLANVDRPGILGIHHPSGESGGQRGPCDVLPGGICWGDTAWRAGFEIADLYDRGYESRAWLVIENWYRSRIEGDAHDQAD